jgi:predicted Zn-dependent peptidase
VSLDDVQQVAAELLAAPQTLAVVGPFGPDRDFAAPAA